MVLPANQIASKSRIGTARGHSVLVIHMIGGLHLIALQKDGGFETLGAGSHSAVARYLAERNCPDIVWDELKKSSEPTYEDFKDILPKYEAITNQMRAIQGY